MVHQEILFVNLPGILQEISLAIAEGIFPGISSWSPPGIALGIQLGISP